MFSQSPMSGGDAARRRSRASVLPFLVCCLGWFALAWKSAAADRPNIVLIFTDDLGYGDLGCHGATKVRTPNIDRLAAEGRRFTDAHSASAVCTPSRYALLTGEYPFRKNLWGPAMNPSPLLVDVGRVTLAGLLKRQGYATACFGKWHLGFGAQPKPDWNSDLKPGPLELGFDHYFGIPVVNSHPPFVWVEDHRVVGLDPADPLVYGGVPPTEVFPEKMMRPAMSGGKAAHALYRDEEAGTTLTEKALAWLRVHQNAPFFLYFATPHIHHPFTPAKRFQGTSDCGRYGDFIHELDWMVGEVTRTLDELKLRDRTLVILTSDNGGMLNVGGQEAWQAGHRMNGDLLGFKFDAWEGGHRVPFIARWPGRIAPGSVSDQLISNVDLVATLAALTGAKLKPGEAPDSVNVLPALTGDPATALRTELVLSPSSPRHLALRDGPWLYIGARGGGGFTADKPGEHLLGGPAALKFAGEENSDIEDGRFKADAPEAQLYHLRSDPRQRRNVIREQAGVAARMRARLEELRLPVASAGRAAKAKGGASPAPKEIYEHPEPVGPLRFDFESGDLHGWHVVDGAFEALVNDRERFHHTYGGAKYNRQGRYFLTTLERKAGGAGNDAQTGSVESPVFKVTGKRASFLVGGGKHANTFVALIDAANDAELLRAQGRGTETMFRVNWDLTRFIGRSVLLRLVDQNQGGWGHVTFDDFSAEAELDERQTATRLAAAKKLKPAAASPVADEWKRPDFGITHSFLATGAKTYILSGEGKVVWEYPANTRDGWVLPNGNVLLAVSKGRDYPGGGVVEVTRAGEKVFEFKGTQAEVNTAQAPDNGHILLTEAGPKPRLLEVTRSGKIAVEFPIQCQLTNFHMQSRMTRKLANGNYLVPQLHDKVVREYTARGEIVWEVKTPNWPFTAIRLANGNTLINCTYGHTSLEVNARGETVWQLSNEDLPAPLIKDACGAQRLPNGNTVITAYGSRGRGVKLLEVTPEKQVVWVHEDDLRHGIHHFQILDTNGRPISDTWR